MKTVILVFCSLLIPTLAMASTSHQQAYLNKETQLALLPNVMTVAQLASEGKPAFAKCAPLEGTKVLIIGEHKGLPIFNKVKVLNGSCRGETGWVSRSKLSARP
jgi:hypothetical protein